MDDASFYANLSPVARDELKRAYNTTALQELRAIIADQMANLTKHQKNLQAGSALVRMSRVVDDLDHQLAKLEPR